MSLQDLLGVVLANLRRIRDRVIMTAAVLMLISLGAGLQRQAQASMMSGEREIPNL